MDLSALVAGGVAGFPVDVALFPLGTLKTRLQAANGFCSAGGFRGIYSGYVEECSLLEELLQSNKKQLSVAM